MFESPDATLLYVSETGANSIRPTDENHPPEHANIPADNPSMPCNAEKTQKRIAKHICVTAAALAGACAVYYGLRTKGTETKAEPGQVQTKLAAGREEMERAKLQLEFYKREAEQALDLSTFYEREGNTGKLLECLEKLKRWKEATTAMSGEPRIRKMDGLVMARTSAQVIEQSLWERVTTTIEHITSLVE